MDPIETFRAQLAAMSPGEWREDDGDIFVVGLDAWTFCKAQTYDNGEPYCWTDAQAKADATGIVRSVNAARRLAAEGAEEWLARMIDPSSWRVFDGYLADVKRKYKGENAGYDPEAFKDKKSIALAQSIIAAIVSEGTDDA